MILAGILLGGYAGYFLVRAIITAPGIGNLFKVVILVGVSGLITTIVGLIRERRRAAHLAELEGKCRVESEKAALLAADSQPQADTDRLQTRREDVELQHALGEIGEKDDLDLEAHAAQQYPQHYHRERGDNSLRSRDYEAAHEEYQRAIDSGGEETYVAYVNKSSTFLMEDRHEECEAACRKALELNPRSAGAYFNLMQVAVARGDEEAADRYLAKAMELDDKIRQRLSRMGLG